MVRNKRRLVVAAAIPTIAFSAALALAHDSGEMTDRGGMMGGGMMGGDGRGGMMTGHGMEGCMQMMQGMHGGSQRPNEQWQQR
jgi:hypothetical protein